MRKGSAVKVARKADTWWLVALAVLLGVSMAIPFLWGRHDIGKARCMSQLHDVWLAVAMYVQEHGVFPATASEIHLDNKALLVCPVTHPGALSYNAALEGWGDYVYHGARIGSMDIEQWGRMPLLHDKAGNHPDRTRTVLYGDGHLEALSEKEFDALMRTSREQLWEPQ